jgi:hypothetical protein
MKQVEYLSASFDVVVDHVHIELSSLNQFLEIERILGPLLRKNQRIEQEGNQQAVESELDNG